MSKRARTDHPVQDWIAQRWSPRAFADRPLGPALVRSLLEAARWAPSCFNEQPWHYLVARREDAELHQRMASCLVDANRTWAAKAPVLMFGIVNTRFARNDKPNRHAYHDLGLATAQLTAEAIAHGVYLHQMAGILSDKIVRTFSLPEGFEPVTGIALGYPGDPESIEPEMAERERATRTRKPQADFVFAGTWGDNPTW